MTTGVRILFGLSVVRNAVGTIVVARTSTPILPISTPTTIQVPKGDQRMVGRGQLATRLANPVTLCDGPGVFLVAASGQVLPPPEQARIACARLLASA
jgi:hypothetical protein